MVGIIEWLEQFVLLLFNLVLFLKSNTLLYSEVLSFNFAIKPVEYQGGEEFM